MRRLILSLSALVLLTAGKPASTLEPELPALEAMLPELTRSLTPSAAEQAFGPPDQITGSGLIIYIYHVEQAHQVYLGFPGYAPITYAKLLTPSGELIEMPLRD
ncbi:MAG: hypothetical protein ICV62_03065 [Cyanobacteria bacterium Co-bin13]|nr:hypothetical protein [Cyanobacteria bacterium Co-bin13]